MSAFVINPYRFSSAFSPTDLSGCALWLDMSDPATLYTDQGSTLVSTNGDLVRRIDDKSGNGRYAESLSNITGMLYTVSAQNGLSALDSDGDASAFYRIEAQAWYSLNSFTAFIVYKANALDAGLDIAWGSVGNGTSAPRVYFGATSSDFAAYLDSSTQWGQNASDTTDYHVHCLLHGSNTAEYFVDGSSKGTASRTSTATPYWSAFGALVTTNGASASAPLDGNYCEIIFYNNALSASERGTVEQYLLNKWGIT